MDVCCTNYRSIIKLNSQDARQSYKARVAGSSPVPPTNEIRHLRGIVSAFFLILGSIVKRNVKNVIGASWNGEIFTEQVRGQRYRIDSAQGGALSRRWISGGCYGGKCSRESP